MKKGTKPPHRRRDFYKVMLLTTAQGWLHYADKSLAVHDNALVFANPLIPYSWERVAGHEAGVAYLFTEEFINPQLKTVGVMGSPLFRVGGHSVLQLPEAPSLLLRGLFEQLLEANYFNLISTVVLFCTTRWTTTLPC